MALLTLSEYKALMGVQAGVTQDDAQITALLEPASQSIETFTGRDFDVAAGASTKTYTYDEPDGLLDIDDCTAITQVQVTIPNTTPRILTSDEYTAMPSSTPVFYYIILHGGFAAFGLSPEMGFTWNLDTYPMISSKPPTIAVTATWGWPAVPQDVKHAVALTIKNFVGSKGGEEGLTAEAIEGWSRSWGNRTAVGQALAIPNRARDLLINYQRFL